MKALLRNYLINLVALLVANQLIPGLTYTGGFSTLALGALGLMVINILVIPLVKVMLLPLNLLTLGLFTWVANVIGLYFLTILIHQIKLIPVTYPGVNINGFVIPEMGFNVLMVAMLASFLIGFIVHLLGWIAK